MPDPHLDFNDLRLFAQVVEHRSFSAAGLALGIPKSTVSRHVTRLEAALGTRLLQRTPRQLNLTEAGRVLYAHCRAMVTEACAGEQAVRSLQSEPSGTLRLSIPAELSDEILAALLPAYMARYPRVGLNVQVTNRLVNLVEDGIDLAVRGTTDQPQDSNSVQIPLGLVHWKLFGAPGLLTSVGELTAPHQLTQVPMLVHACSDAVVNSQALWSVATGESMSVPVQTRMQSDNLKVLKQAALAGLGLCGLPTYCCDAECRRGALVPVLESWRPRSGHLVALVPARKGITPALRALLDMLKRELAPQLRGE